MISLIASDISQKLMFTLDLGLKKTSFCLVFYVEVHLKQSLQHQYWGKESDIS